MATATLTGVPTTISLAESITGWTGDSFALEPDIKVQGGNSVACAITPNAGASQEIYYTGFTAANLNAVHLRLWFNISFIANLATTDPIRVFISDGTNTAYWNFDASSYAGGWAQAVIYTGNTPVTGTRPTGNSTRVGMRFAVATRPRNVVNSWFDAWYYGGGYTVTGGTSGDELNWSHIAAVDKVQAYNIVSLVDGVYFLTGEIYIGSGATTTYWKEVNQICVFQDLPVLNVLYRIQFNGSGCIVTITGGAYAAAGSMYYLFIAGNLLNSFTMSGKQVVRYLSTFFYNLFSIYNCVFDSGVNSITPYLANFYNNTISNCTNTIGALIYPTNDAYIHSLKFINNSTSIEYELGSDNTSPTFNNLIFDDVSGNYDVNNTSGSTVSIALTNGSNANSYNPMESAVTFTASFTLTLTDIIEGAQVTIVNSSTRAELQNSIAPASGIITYSHSGGTTIDILIIDLDYDPNLSSIYDLTLDYNNSLIKFQMIDDVNYDNPT